MRTIQIEVDDEQYEQLKRTKDTHGWTWRGMLIFADDELADGEGP